MTTFEVGNTLYGEPDLSITNLFRRMEVGLLQFVEISIDVSTMYLPKDCRVITIGDGDLSFSRALLQHVKPENLIASTYDTEETLRSKYQRNAINDLKNVGVNVQHGIDITDELGIASFAKTVCSYFDGADIVIFNHPLVPTQKSYAQYQKERDKNANLANRELLFYFLKHSFERLLAPDGERLCYITTKSVKPYSHWHIETSLTANQTTHRHYQYLGNEPFDVRLFKNYMVRNVDRDKCVKHEASDIYVYSDKPNHKIKSQLQDFKYNQEGLCALCRKGPFENEADWILHQNTRIHKAQKQYHDAWMHFSNEL